MISVVYVKVQLDGFRRLEVKVLVTIANDGTGNDHYLARVLDEYRGIRGENRPCGHVDVAKDLGKDVEVVVGSPGRIPGRWPLLTSGFLPSDRTTTTFSSIWKTTY